MQFCLDFKRIAGCTPQMTNISVPLSKHRPSENISSPTTFPSNQSVYCSWNISVPVGKRIRIHFTSFHLAKSANCSISAVKLIEKKGLISTATGRYCGRDTPSDVLSSSSSLSVIYLATNGCTLNHTGFQAFVSLAPEGEKLYIELSQFVILECQHKFKLWCITTCCRNEEIALTTT